MVENGAVIDQGGDKNGTTPLFIAIKLDHTEIAKVLLVAGADPIKTKCVKNLLSKA